MISNNNNDFAVFILTYGRAEKVRTYRTLREQGYTGKIYLMCSDDDKQLTDYKRIYGDEVIVFSKKDWKGKFDIGDNFTKENVVVYARNANPEIAKNLGLKYYLQLDDDYNNFRLRFAEGKKLSSSPLRDLNKIFDIFLEFLENSPATSIAFAQGGDYIGGIDASILNRKTVRRKLMNTFFNKVSDPYQFLGRINEDVNCYIHNGKLGKIFLTHPNICVTQLQTQTNSGGLTEFYLDGGTYQKSFYTILYNPSAIKISLMGRTDKRLHHFVQWKNAVPQIIEEKWRKN